MLVGTISQEKAIVGAFSVIMKTDGSFAALMLGSEADTHMVGGRKRRVEELWKLPTMTAKDLEPIVGSLE